SEGVKKSYITEEKCPMYTDIQTEPRMEEEERKKKATLTFTTHRYVYWHVYTLREIAISLIFY
ncbi:hypothetical protein CSUI_004755, partial [Cystoisospora suis]